MEFEKQCPSEYVVAGFQDGEKALSVVRLVSTAISVSIISSWYVRDRLGGMLIFFIHWLSGLVHLLAGLMLEKMVLLCVLDIRFLSCVRALKYLELVGGNMLAVTNVVICVNLGRIVAGHRTLSEVKTVFTPTVLVGSSLLSFVEAAACIPFWHTWIVGGAYIFVEGEGKAQRNWVLLSYFLFEAIGAVIMTVILVALIIFRRDELCQVWHVSRRIKLHLALTVIAVVVDVGIMAAGLDVLRQGAGYEAIGIMLATWKVRYAHIAMDTLVLYTSLATPSYLLDDCRYSQRSVACSEEDHDAFPSHVMTDHE